MARLCCQNLLWGPTGYQRQASWSTGPPKCLALFVGVWLHFRDTKREREAIKRAFGFFLPPAVVDQLTHNLGPMPDSNRVVFGACLSTDVEKNGWWPST